MEKEVLNLILVEVREMKGDMSEVKNRLGNLETDMTEVKSRLTNVENKITNLENKITNLEDKITNLEEMTEFNTENIESIKNVVTSHYMEFKKFVKSNNTQHNVYNAKLLQYNKEN